MKRLRIKTVEKSGKILRLIVIRPECAKLAVQFCDLINRLRNNGEMTEQQTAKAFQEMLSLQHYRVMGFIEDRVPPHILKMEAEGLESEPIGLCLPGDSVIDESDLSKWQNLSADLRDSQVVQ